LSVHSGINYTYTPYSKLRNTLFNNNYHKQDRRTSSYTVTYKNHSRAKVVYRNSVVMFTKHELKWMHRMCLPSVLKNYKRSGYCNSEIYRFPPPPCSERLRFFEHRSIRSLHRHLLISIHTSCYLAIQHHVGLRPAGAVGI
jgi:hypothetical protein